MVSQDKRLINPPKLKLPKQLRGANHLNLNPYSEGSLTIVVEDNLHNEYPDYIEEPVMLISEKLKRIVGKYQRNITFNLVVLVERNRRHQEVYYMMGVPEIDCLVDDIELDAMGNLKDFTLDEAKIGSNRIFRVKGHNKKLIVRLDVAESLLRRDAAGITFEKLEDEEEFDANKKN